VVVLSVRDFIETPAPAPDWLENARQGAKQRGLDKLAPEEIDAETRRRTPYRQPEYSALRSFLTASLGPSETPLRQAAQMRFALN
jgi:hypothetical protein